MDIPILRFNSGKPGTRLVVFGAIHGNEPCGPRAIHSIAQKIESGEIPLARGSLLCIPGANPNAFAQKVRQTEENLNRVFRKTDSPSSYEQKIANELCALLDAEADMLLDIHSTSAPGPMSVFTDYPSEENLALAEALGAEYIILDWPLVYAQNQHGLTSSCTSDYAHEIGIPSATVECGQHEDLEATARAEKAIIRTLSHAGIIDGSKETVSPTTKIRLTSVEKKYKDGDVFTKHWGHLEPIKQGEVIAQLESGEQVTAKEDCVMVLPKHHAVAGEEWYYLAVTAKENPAL